MTRQVHVGEPVETDDGFDAVAPIPAPEGSALFDLRALRERKLKDLYKDLPVPRWGEDGTPEIVVRYKPSKPQVALRATEKRRTENDPDWLILANADVLVDACIGVYAVYQGKKYSLKPGEPNAPWTKFDRNLAENLGIETNRAVEVVRALYLTDGDLIGAVNALAAWSGTVLPQIDEESLGE